MTTTLQNTPVEIDLTISGKTTGWTISGDTATHESCNAGSAYLRTILTPGVTYTVTYRVDAVTGVLRSYIGSTTGALITTTGFKTETITATGTNPRFRFFSDGVASITLFGIRDDSEDTSQTQMGTIVWAEKYNKWPSFRTFTPESGFSLFTNFYAYRRGQLYKFDKDIEPRNQFFGNQYKSSIQFVANADRGVPKTYESLSYEANTLMITSTDGITTSLGQISDLNSDDFLHELLDDGVNEVAIYDIEGMYSASFRMDKNEDINTGSDLKGTYIVVELITQSSGTLRLKNVLVNSVNSPIGSR